eukprot:TRINITY_DN5350_c0_g1_i2.p1 TRINITY_DN5350_c0_g1~~TRINITY_DN5350_c0_g1_i2.p1  ORF type:complete len:585 (+),score=127.01 TRINITY_DN5350_c0_g1_i2:43-1797(+)
MKKVKLSFALMLLTNLCPIFVRGASVVVEPPSYAGLHIDVVPLVPCYEFFGTDTVFENLTITSNSLNRGEFQAMTNVLPDPVLPSVVVLNSIDGGGAGQGFFDYCAIEAAQRGFKAIIFRTTGDTSSAAITALHLYTTFTCPIPTFVISQDFDSVLLNAQVVTLQMIPNPEVPFIHGPIYVCFVVVPAYILSIAVMIASAVRIPYQLRRKPTIRNTALMVCIFNFIQAALLFTFISWSLRTDVPLNWIALNVNIMLTAIASFGSSFAISMKYHRILAGIYGPPTETSPLSERIFTTRNAAIFAGLHVVLMIVFEFLAMYANSVKVVYLAAACFLYSISKFVNAAYCFYTQKQMITIYEQTTDSNQQSQKRLTETARRLAIGSTLNFLGMAIGTALGFRIYRFQHTWIAFPYMIVLFCATGLLELMTQIRSSEEKEPQTRSHRANSEYTLWGTGQAMLMRMIGTNVDGPGSINEDEKEQTFGARATEFWSTIKYSLKPGASPPVLQPYEDGGSFARSTRTTRIGGGVFGDERTVSPRDLNASDPAAQRMTQLALVNTSGKGHSLNSLVQDNAKSSLDPNQSHKAC